MHVVRELQSIDLIAPTPGRLPVRSCYGSTEPPPQAVLDEIERMASQGMDLGRIAWRLGYTPAALALAAEVFDCVMIAYYQGNARLADEKSFRLSEAGNNGDVAAAKFLLQTKAGFNAPPAVQINLGQPTDVAVPDGILDHVQGHAERTRAMLTARDAETAPTAGAGAVQEQEIGDPV